MPLVSFDLLNLKSQPRISQHIVDIKLAMVEKSNRRRAIDT